MDTKKVSKDHLLGLLRQLPAQPVLELVHELRMRLNMVYQGMANAKPPVERPYLEHDTMAVAALLQEAIDKLRPGLEAFDQNHLVDVKKLDDVWDVEDAHFKMSFAMNYGQHMVERLNFFNHNKKKKTRRAA